LNAYTRTQLKLSHEKMLGNFAEQMYGVRFCLRWPESLGSVA